MLDTQIKEIKLIIYWHANLGKQSTSSIITLSIIRWSIVPTCTWTTVGFIACKSVTNVCVAIWAFVKTGIKKSNHGNLLLDMINFYLLKLNCISSNALLELTIYSFFFFFKCNAFCICLRVATVFNRTF